MEPYSIVQFKQPSGSRIFVRGERPGLPHDEDCHASSRRPVLVADLHQESRASLRGLGLPFALLLESTRSSSSRSDYDAFLTMRISPTAAEGRRGNLLPSAACTAFCCCACSNLLLTSHRGLGMIRV